MKIIKTENLQVHDLRKMNIMSFRDGEGNIKNALEDIHQCAPFRFL